MGTARAALLGVLDEEAAAGRVQHAGITHLTARLGVERRRFEDDLALLARREGLDARTAAQQGHHLRFATRAVVTAESGLHVDGGIGAQVDTETAGGAGALTLRRHRDLETFLVDAEPALTRDIGGEISREAISVVELEDGGAVDRRNRPRDLLQAVDGLVEQRHAVAERLGEALFLLGEHARGLRRTGAQFRVGLTHLGVERRDELVEERSVDAEFMAVADGAPDDATQHVAPTLVGGQHTVDDEESARTDVIGDHPQRGVREVVGAGEIGGRADDAAEEVDVVVVGDALHHGRKPLEARTRVDRWLGQRREGAVRRAIVLHEHEVPDFDVPVAVLVGRARRPTWDVRAVVVEDLGAGAAGTGVTHRPEVRLLPHAGDAILRYPDLVDPDARRFVVVTEDRHPEAVRIELQGAGDEGPGEMDGVALEVVAEGEVPQHLEEGVVARGIADVLEIVVLSAGAHAALRGRRARVVAQVLAEEDVLELHHASVGEEQRRIVAGDQRTRGDDGVAALTEELEEGTAHFGGGHVGRFGGSHSVWSSEMSGSWPVASRISSDENPRYCKNRPCRPRSAHDAGGWAPNLRVRTSRQSATKSGPAANASSMMAALKPSWPSS